MNPIENKTSFSPNDKFLLGLHSSGDDLGVGIIQINNEKEILRSNIFKGNKDLSNYLFKYIEEILPSQFWPQIIRLAVSTGPGSYTGTRLSVVLARTLAQQLNCQMDGVSSFEIMAYRLAREIKSKYKEKDFFWITQDLERRGIIAGKYQISLSKKNIEIIEIKAPSLLTLNMKVSPSINAKENLKEDIKRLLLISLNLHKRNKLSKWQDALPIYPTSPIDRLS